MPTEHHLNYEDPWQATAALLFLMTQWSQNQCARIAPLIIEHLSILEHHPSKTLSPIMRDICAGLHDNWLVLGANRRLEQSEAVANAVSGSNFLH